MAKKAVRIESRYSGSGQRGPLSIEGDPDHIQVVLANDDGSREVLFTGSDFTEAGFSKKMRPIKG